MVNKFHYLFGGTERYVQELTSLLQDQGHKVIPFAMSDPRNVPTPYSAYFVSPVEFFDREQRSAPWTIAERVIYSREARRKMERLIKDVRPDVAHVNNIYHHISPSVFDALRTQNVPAVMTLHDYKLICPTYSMWVDGAICDRCAGGRFYQCALHRCNHGSWMGSLLNAIEAYVHRWTHIYEHVDQFISPSRFLRDKHIAEGISSERIVHIPNFVLADQYSPDYGHDGYFAYAGRLTGFKGVGTLLDAHALIESQAPLLIAGDGPMRAELEMKVARVGLENVRFLGHLSGDALQKLISRAMFMVVPSEWYENCPYAILEAFAMGTPVIATTRGGIPELVEQDKNGLLVPPGDPESLAEAMERLLSSGSRREEMGRAARQDVERVYNGQRYVVELSQVYRQVTGSSL